MNGQFSVVYSVIKLYFMTSYFATIYIFCCKNYKYDYTAIFTLSYAQKWLFCGKHNLVESLLKWLLCCVSQTIVLKEQNSDFINFIFNNFYKRKLNSNEYGYKKHNKFTELKITLIFSYCFKDMSGTAFSSTNIDVPRKPFSLSHCTISSSLNLLKLRKNCNRLLFNYKPAWFLVGHTLSCKRQTRKFANQAIEPESLNDSICKNLAAGKWPTDNILIKKQIDCFIINVQNQILIQPMDKKLDFLTSFVFDIKNRIYSIDLVFKNNKSNNYNQVGYSNLNKKSDKFLLLKQTKYSQIKKLPECKTIIVEIPKQNKPNEKRCLGISMPIDKVLQRMFLNFLDVIIESKLHPNVFSYRKCRNARMAVASVYKKLNTMKYLSETAICSVDLRKCFDSLLHSQILKIYPFPKEFNFLLKRWLNSLLIVNNKENFKVIGKQKKGIPQGSIIGPSIANVMINNQLPANLNKENKNRIKLWVDIFIYSDDILVISNNYKLFYKYIVKLRNNFKKIGLLFNNNKTKIITNIKNKKIRFNFLGFEFIVMPRHLLKYSPLLSNFKNLHSLKSGTYGYGILLKPLATKFSNIKKKLKFEIKKILHQPKNKIYVIFNKINSILLGWSQYFYFSQGCVYCKRLDNFVFKNLRKILVRKYRYHGLLRPKWVAHNFIGLGKINPNGKKYQFRALKFINKNKSNYVYIWYSSDTFTRLSITSFLLDKKIRIKNYYLNRLEFKNALTKLISKRLVSDLKFKLYTQQKGNCIFCNKHIDENLLLNRSTKIHIHHIVPRSLKKKYKINDKVYESRNNKTLLHERCHLILHKNSNFNKNHNLLQNSVPKKPIIK